MIHFTLYIVTTLRNRLSFKSGQKKTDSFDLFHYNTDTDEPWSKFTYINKLTPVLFRTLSLHIMITNLKI